MQSLYLSPKEAKKGGLKYSESLSPRGQERGRKRVFSEMRGKEDDSSNEDDLQCSKVRSPSQLSCKVVPKLDFFGLGVPLKKLESGLLKRR